MKIIRCNKCRKIAVVYQDSACPTMCCDQEMVVLKAGETDGAAEKHVPEVTADGNRIHVAVGSVEHPSLDNHYIQFIVLETEKGHQTVNLKAGDKPEADFIVADGDKAVAAYEYCNLHGLWKADI